MTYLLSLTEKLRVRLVAVTFFAVLDYGYLFDNMNAPAQYSSQVVYHSGLL